MEGTNSWISIIIVFVVCGVYYYFVSKFGDKLAFKIEEAMWGDRYRWEGRRATGRHYSVILSIFATIWVGVTFKSGILTILAFAVTSIVFYTVWRVIEDMIGKGVDTVGDKAMDMIDRKHGDTSPETKEPSKLADRYQQKDENGEMFCAYCGKKISRTAGFCPYCGKELK